MRVLLLLCLLGLLIFPPMATGAELLRVAILEDVPEVQLTATEDILISTPSGKRVGGGRLPVLHVGFQDNLTVAGHPTSQGILIFKTRHGGTIQVQGHPYRGEVLIQKKPAGLLVVNLIDLEQYLLGVIPAEMPAAWPMEALKAQAVISRTYALYRKREQADKPYDLLASVLSQVYEGERNIHPRASDAVRQTAGQILTYEGAPARAFFHSTSAGPTEDARDHWEFSQSEVLPYLAGVSCPLDQRSPYYHWDRTFRWTELEAALKRQGHSVAGVTGLVPTQWSRAGRVLFLSVQHASGEMSLKGDDLRKALGFRALPSTRFTLHKQEDGLLFRGMGYGHGVGLCQWGAMEMARRGDSFEQILRHYYPSTELQPLRTPLI
jgi:stage II sporulation protein D